MENVKVYWKYGTALCIAVIDGVDSHNHAIECVREQIPPCYKEGQKQKFAVLALVK